MADEDLVSGIVISLETLLADVRTATRMIPQQDLYMLLLFRHCHLT